MKIYGYLIILLLSVACASKQAVTFYVLNSDNNLKALNYHKLRIGINDIKIPNYLDQAPLVVFLTHNVNKLLENDQWSGRVEDNIRQVLQTDLSNLLPNAIVQNYPWSAQFHTDYLLNININRFNVDVYGNSNLEIIYQINHKNNIHQYVFKSHYFNSCLKPSVIAQTMNQQLTKFSVQIARQF